MDDHYHNYYGYQVKADFEPLTSTDVVAQAFPDDVKDLYRRVEYAISICKCGESVKRKVQYE